MHKREILIDFLLLIIVLASFIALLVSGGFMILEMFKHVSSSTVNLSFIAALVSMILLLVSFALLGRRLDSRDNCETQSSEDQFEQKYVSLMTDDTKARREFIELYKKKEEVN